MAYRMTFWRELKWLIASYLLGWTIELIQKEASAETLSALHRLMVVFACDQVHETIKMRDQKQ